MWSINTQVHCNNFGDTNKTYNTLKARKGYEIEYAIYNY
jgi:hypothetical protein